MLLARLAPQVDGFILASPRLSKQRIEAHASRRPVILVNRDVADIPRILIDSSAAFEKAVDHLAALGHRSVVYVGAPKASWANQQRQKAVTKAAARNGITATLLHVARPSYDAGRASVADILPTGATAVLAVDDVVAQGIIAGLSGFNLTVPNDISVIGCDDIIAMMTHPPLSSVAVYAREAGRRAAELLVAILNGPSPKETRIVQTSDLVLRSTVAPPSYSPGVKRKKHETRSQQ